LCEKKKKERNERWKRQVEAVRKQGEVWELVID